MLPTTASSWKSKATCIRATKRRFPIRASRRSAHAFWRAGANYIHNRHDVLRHPSPESLKTTKLVLNFLDQLDQSAVFLIERMIPEDQKRRSMLSEQDAGKEINRKSGCRRAPLLRAEIAASRLVHQTKAVPAYVPRRRLSVYGKTKKMKGTGSAMKFSIRHKIIFFFAGQPAGLFRVRRVYRLCGPALTMTQTRFAISQMVESKANEVSMWVKRMAVEYCTIAAIPAFSLMMCARLRR
ncbi:MAG: hypothetical protein ACLVJX_10305 [Merdibacter sp.]